MTSVKNVPCIFRSETKIHFQFFKCCPICGILFLTTSMVFIFTKCTQLHSWSQGYTIILICHLLCIIANQLLVGCDNIHRYTKLPQVEQVTPNQTTTKNNTTTPDPHAAQHAEVKQTCRATCTAQLACHTSDKSWPAKLRGMRNDILAAWSLLYNFSYVTHIRPSLATLKMTRWVWAPNLKYHCVSLSSMLSSTLSPNPSHPRLDGY